MVLNTLSRMLVNTLYRVPGRVKRFKEQFPEAHVLAAGATKARKMMVDVDPRYDAGWATARRDVLILTTTNLHCGDWVIPLEVIQDATLLHITGGSLLKVSTLEGLHYQFGLSRDPAWEAQTALPLTVQTGALELSRFSLIVRLLLLVWLGWSLAQDIAQQSWNFYTVLKILLVIWVLLPFINRFRARRGS